MSAFEKALQIQPELPRGLIGPRTGLEAKQSGRRAQAFSRTAEPEPGQNNLASAPGTGRASGLEAGSGAGHRGFA